MNIALWIVQILLAAVFLLSGVLKFTLPRETQIERAAYVEDFSQGAIRIIGALEILGGIGLLLPALTGILPWLVPLAAVGLALTMLGAAITHARRGEFPIIVANLILLAMAAFVAYGRFVTNPL